MNNPHHATLRYIFHPNRLSAIHALYFAWADSGGLPNGALIIHLFGNGNDIAERLYNFSFDDCLKPLSLIPLTEIPSLLLYLPAPKVPEFPSQAYGLYALIDQAPRICLASVSMSVLSGSSRQYISLSLALLLKMGLISFLVPCSGVIRTIFSFISSHHGKEPRAGTPVERRAAPATNLQCSANGRWGARKETTHCRRLPAIA